MYRFSVFWVVYSEICVIKNLVYEGFGLYFKVVVENKIF